MAGYPVKLLNYNSSQDTILSISRRQYIKDLERKLNILFNDKSVEKVYSDLPENVTDWFDNYGHIHMKVKEGVDVESITLIDEINDMLLEIANEDGILVEPYDHETWVKIEEIYPSNERYKDFRRIK